MHVRRKPTVSAITMMMATRTRDMKAPAGRPAASFTPLIQFLFASAPLQSVGSARRLAMVVHCLQSSWQSRLSTPLRREYARLKATEKKACALASAAVSPDQTNRCRLGGPELHNTLIYFLKCTCCNSDLPRAIAAAAALVRRAGGVTSSGGSSGRR